MRDNNRGTAVISGGYTPQFVEINGHKIKYASFGSGENVVFLHGWGASISAFLFVAKAISDRYRVTLLDFAGFGESEEPQSVYSVKDYADDVVKLMRLLKISEATLVGHSFGGRVCLEIVGYYPNIVKKLVLVDSAGLKPRRGLKYYVKVGIHKLLKAVGLKGLKGSADYRVLSENMRGTFKAVVNYDQTYLLEKIKCPTAIFWGNDDKDTPAYMARRLNKSIPDSSIFWLNGGHFAYAEDSRKFISILKAFLG
ncbi:MAG: alpha/beta hydrolase [Clostridia bacterium]|nr:alpha/beta hydrolase [Clostridia bacterium]